MYLLAGNLDLKLLYKIRNKRPSNAMSDASYNISSSVLLLRHLNIRLTTAR